MFSLTHNYFEFERLLSVRDNPYIFLDFFGPIYPLCQHRYSTERQQKKTISWTHPVNMLTWYMDGPLNALWGRGKYHACRKLLLDIMESCCAYLLMSYLDVILLSILIIKFSQKNAIEMLTKLASDWIFTARPPFYLHSIFANLQFEIHKVLA